MKKPILAMSLLAVLSTGMFSFASANSQEVEKNNIVVTESKELQDLTDATAIEGSWIIAWTKSASSAVLCWEN